MPAESVPDVDDEWSVEELAARSHLPVRTIREYQSIGLVPPPERRGRRGVYRPSHLQRLELIGRLQSRGYSLAGIGDLLGSWRSGADLGEVLGLDPDQLVHLEEPGMPATLYQLSRLVPQLVPDRLGAVIDAGLVEVCGPDRYAVPSPSLLQLAIDALAAGYPADAVLELLTAIHSAADAVARATIDLLADPPAPVDGDAIDALAQRGRGLLAHGTGRSVIHAIGQHLGIEHGTQLGDALRSRAAR